MNPADFTATKETDMESIEQKVAREIVNAERIAKVLARTGGEQMHVLHYDFRQALRDAVLAAADEACDEHGMPRIMDRDLSEIFPAIDAIAEKLFLRRMFPA